MSHPHTAQTQDGQIVNGLRVDFHEFPCKGMDEDGNWLGPCLCYALSRKCKVCHEPVGVKPLPRGVLGEPHIWFHPNTGEEYCFTGDGSVAYPEDVMFDVEVHFTLPAATPDHARAWVINMLSTVVEEGLPGEHDWWIHEDSVKEVLDAD